MGSVQINGQVAHRHIYSPVINWTTREVSVFNSSTPSDNYQTCPAVHFACQFKNFTDYTFPVGNYDTDFSDYAKYTVPEEVFWEVTPHKHEVQKLAGSNALGAGLYRGSLSRSSGSQYPTPGYECLLGHAQCKDVNDEYYILYNLIGSGATHPAAQSYSESLMDTDAPGGYNYYSKNASGSLQMAAYHKWMHAHHWESAQLGGGAGGIHIISCPSGHANCAFEYPAPLTYTVGLCTTLDDYQLGDIDGYGLLGSGT